MVVRGRKRVVLAPPDAGPSLRASPLWSDAANHAAGDIRADLPGVQSVDLSRGQALFVPEGWWHSVTSDAGTIAVNFWWRSSASAALETAGMASYHFRRSGQALLEAAKARMLEAARQEAAMSAAGLDRPLAACPDLASARRRLLWLTTEGRAPLAQWMAELVAAAKGTLHSWQVLELLTSDGGEIVLDAFLEALEAEKARGGPVTGWSMADSFVGGPSPG